MTLYKVLGLYHGESTVPKYTVFPYDLVGTLSYVFDKNIKMNIFYLFKNYHLSENKAWKIANKKNKNMNW